MPPEEEASGGRLYGEGAPVEAPFLGTGEPALALHSPGPQVPT